MNIQLSREDIMHPINDENTNHAFACPGWETLMTDLAATAASLIDEHRQGYAGRPLTWRMLHELECRAITQLKTSRKHSPTLLHLIRNDPGVFAYPISDAPANLSSHGAMPVVMAELWSAWQRLH
jgi:hypothetical protein